MELHAFERMAQSMDAALFPTDPVECDGGLLPQPMTVFPEDTPPGMAYVPYQMWGEVYEADMGISRGTMFPVLDKPFLGMEGGCGK
ncbi:MAG: spore coat associated protein CotJA [Ruminococcus sp.]|nr:spore coat associated protein CotJA [Ruminococcus sp.]